MKILRFCLLITALALVGSSARAAAFDRIIVFGDSLSDTGNIFQSSAATFPPSPPYGGLEPASPAFAPGRFSNGPVWVEYLAESLDVPAPVARGVDPSLPGGTNYAWGGAVTGLVPAEFIPSLVLDPGKPEQIQTGGVTVGQQIGQYVGDVVGGVVVGPDENDLFIVWAGSNDILLLNESKPGNAVKNLQQYLKTLISIGAKQILVPNMPAIENAPAVSVGAPSFFIANGLPSDREIAKRARKFNTKLSETLAKITSKHPDVTIYGFDVYSLFEAVINDPASFGFNSATSVPVLNEEALFVEGYLDILNNPFDSLFWDGVHVTTTAHQLLAVEAVKVLGGVSPGN